MREQIRKPIDNQDLYDGAAEAFRRGWRKVKLYFMCGLPGERPADLDGIVEMAETIARIGKDVTGRYADVTASVSNFVPKPHTPYQWNGMQTREYFHWAHRYLRSQVKLRSVTVKCHDIERSLLEGILTRGDRRVAAGARGSLAARGPARRLDRALRPQALVGRPSTTSASTSRSTASATGPSTRSSPGTTSTSRRAASTWPRSRPARSSSSRRWPGRSDGPGFQIRRFDARTSGVESWQPRRRPKLLTAEEFMAADLGEGTFELVRGEVVEVPPPMPEHGRVCVNVGFVLETYGRQSGLGYALSNDSAVVTERGPDTVRGADVCFYSHARWPRAAGRQDLAPGAARSGRRGRLRRAIAAAQILRKSRNTSQPGVSWSGSSIRTSRSVVDLSAAMTNRHLVLHEDDVIENLPELPGFRCPVADFFV